MQTRSFLLLLLVGFTAASTVLQLRWSDSEGFVTDIGIGTPATVHTFTVHNEQASLYVLGQACVGCANSSTRFDPLASSSFKAGKTRFQSYDPQGQVSGLLGEDRLRLGTTDLPPLSIGVVSLQAVFNKSVDRSRVASGSLGLGPYLGVRQGFFPRSLYGTIGGANVTFRVDESGKTGQVLLGAQTNKICSPNFDLVKEYIRNVYPHSYSDVYEDVFTLDMIAVNGRSISTKLPAIFSLNSERWYLRGVNILAKSFRASGRTQVVDCNGNFPKVDVVIGGNTYPIPGEALVKKIDDKTCILNVGEAAAYRSRPVIGKSFFQHYCVSYDHYKSVIGISKVW